jgi:hypothetical protein
VGAQALVPLGLKDAEQLRAQLKECEEKGKGKRDSSKVVPEKDAQGAAVVFCRSVRRELHALACPVRQIVRFLAEIFYRICRADVQGAERRARPVRILQVDLRR